MLVINKPIKLINQFRIMKIQQKITKSNRNISSNRVIYNTLQKNRALYYKRQRIKTSQKSDTWSDNLKFIDRKKVGTDFDIPFYNRVGSVVKYPMLDGHTCVIGSNFTDVGILADYAFTESSKNKEVKMVSGSEFLDSELDGNVNYIIAIGLEDISPQAANKIIGMCGNKFILRVDGIKTICPLNAKVHKTKFAEDFLSIMFLGHEYMKDYILQLSSLSYGEFLAIKEEQIRVCSFLNNNPENKKSFVCLKTLGKRLVAIREKLNLSREEIAEKHNIYIEEIASLENGTTGKINLKLLFRYTYIFQKHGIKCNTKLVDTDKSMALEDLYEKVDPNDVL